MGRKNCRPGAGNHQETQVPGDSVVKPASAGGEASIAGQGRPPHAVKQLSLCVSHNGPSLCSGARSCND